MNHDGFRNSWGELDNSNSLLLYLMRLLVDEYRLRVTIVFSDGRLHAVRYVRWHFKMYQYKRSSLLYTVAAGRWKVLKRLEREYKQQDER